MVKYQTKKEKTDAQKGKIFTKLGRELAVAVKWADLTLKPMQSSGTQLPKQNQTICPMIP